MSVVVIVKSTKFFDDLGTTRGDRGGVLYNFCAVVAAPVVIVGNVVAAIAPVVVLEDALFDVPNNKSSSP